MVFDDFGLYYQYNLNICQQKNRPDIYLADHFSVYLLLLFAKLINIDGNFVWYMATA
jgi:hypothetical protein